MALTAEGVKLLRETQRLIAREPKYFDMGKWRSKDEDSCGTVCCIGGWVAHLAGHREFFGVSGAALLALGIAEDVGSSLFYVDAWPTDLEHAYDVAEGDAERARIACERINRFIAEHSLPAGDLATGE